MDSNDLSIALIVAKAALKNRRTFDVALDEMTYELSKKFKKKRDYNFVAPPMRKSRHFDAAATVKKIRGVCMYKTGQKSIKSIEQFRESLESGEWIASDRVCICLVRNLIESVIRLLQYETIMSSQVPKLMEILMQTADLAFSRCESNGTLILSTLYFILTQLAFGFSFKEGINHPVFGIFKAITGVRETPHGIPDAERLLSTVVFTSEVIKFVVDIVHMFASKYTPEKFTEAKRISLACLTIHGDSDIIDYLHSLQW